MQVRAAGVLRLLLSTFGSTVSLTLESCPRLRVVRMKTETDTNQAARPSGRGRWAGIAFAIVAVVGLSYAALRFWNRPNQTVSAVASVPTEAIVVPVEGMSCQACVARVKKTLKDTPGVSEVRVSLEKHEAEIRYEPAKTSAEKVVKAIDEMGYKAGTPRAKEKAQ